MVSTICFWCFTESYLVIMSGWELFFPPTFLTSVYRGSIFIKGNLKYETTVVGDILTRCIIFVENVTYIVDRNLILSKGKMN